MVAGSGGWLFSRPYCSGGAESGVAGLVGYGWLAFSLSVAVTDRPLRAVDDGPVGADGVNRRSEHSGGASCAPKCALAPVDPMACLARSIFLGNVHMVNTAATYH